MAQDRLCVAEKRKPNAANAEKPQRKNAPAFDVHGGLHAGEGENFRANI